MNKSKIDENAYHIGEKIKARRKELNMKQSQVAEFVGCTPQQIQKYEAGISNMTIQAFFKICQALHTHPTRFLSGFVFSEASYNDCDDNLEDRLLSAFRTVDNKTIQGRIVSLVESLVSTSTT